MTGWSWSTTEAAFYVKRKSSIYRVLYTIYNLAGPRQDHLLLISGLILQYLPNLTSCSTSEGEVLPAIALVYKTIGCSCWGCTQTSLSTVSRTETMNTDYILRCLRSMLCNDLDPCLNKWPPNARSHADKNADFIKFFPGTQFQSRREKVCVTDSSFGLSLLE